MNIHEIKKKYKFYLDQSYILSLNLTDDEIIRYMPAIVKIVDEQVKCDKLPNNICINESYKHLRISRDKNNLLFFELIDCHKHKPINNWYINDFQSKNNKFINIVKLDAEAKKNKNSNKHLIIEKYLKQHLFFLVKKCKPTNYISGIYLYGDYGIGKTLLMFSLLNTIQELGPTVALVSLPKLVQRLKNNFGSNQNYLNEQMMNNLEKIDFLVLDDIGAEQTDSWFYNQFLFDLLDFRYANKKVTFFTSNYQLNQLLSKWKSSTSMTKIDITRIIERIKALTNNCSVQLKDVNYRYSNQIIKS